MDKYKETFETWNKIASLYEEKFMDLDLYNKSYDYICKNISKPNAKLLDIGCGPGNITKYLLKKRPGYNVLGIDISPKMIEVARLNNPSAKFSVMDCRDIDKLQDKYDGIIAGFYLPYLSQKESKELIKSSCNLLNQKGLLYLSFVEGDPVNSGFKIGKEGRVFFNYYELEELKKHLVEEGFSNFKSFEFNFETSEKDFDKHKALIAFKR